MASFPPNLGTHAKLGSDSEKSPLRLGGEGAEGALDLSEAVVALGGDVLLQAERGEEVGREGGEVGGGFAIVQLAEEGSEALHERGFGLHGKAAAAPGEGADEPDARGAAADERGLGA